MKIWVLLSERTDAYDQPDNVLEAWWTVKPDFNTLAMAIGFGGFPCDQSDLTLYVTELWLDGSVRPSERMRPNTNYRLIEINEGVLT
jgi:hypothetical protein